MDAIHEHHVQAKLANIERDRQIVRRALTNTTFWLLIIALVVYAAMFSAFTFHMYRRSFKRLPSLVRLKSQGAW